jgi:hypothetical protein
VAIQNELGLGETSESAEMEGAVAPTLADADSESDSGLEQDLPLEQYTAAVEILPSKKTVL